MIRDAQGKLAITPGDWKASCAPWDMAVTAKGADILGARNQTSISYGLTDEANIELAAEAGTVTNATGRTPAELRDLVRELRGCVQASLNSEMDIGHAIATIEKSEGV
jgi:hypothetical protein